MKFFIVTKLISTVCLPNGNLREAKYYLKCSQVSWPASHEYYTPKKLCLSARWSVNYLLTLAWEKGVFKIPRAVGHPVEYKNGIFVLIFTGGHEFMVSKVLCAIFWKFALPPFSPPLPSVVEFSDQKRHWTIDTINNWPPVHSKSVFWRALNIKLASWEHVRL